MGDVGRLLVKGDQHGGAARIKTAGPGAAVTNAFDHAAHELVEINPGGGGNFTSNQAQPRIDHRLAGNAAGGILGENSVKHGIAHLVADLVGVAFRDRFRGEDVPAHA